VIVKNRLSLACSQSVNQRQSSKSRYPLSLRTRPNQSSCGHRLPGYNHGILFSTATQLVIASSGDRSQPSAPVEFRYPHSKRLFCETRVPACENTYAGYVLPTIWSHRETSRSACPFLSLFLSPTTSTIHQGNCSTISLKIALWGGYVVALYMSKIGMWTACFPWHFNLSVRSRTGDTFVVRKKVKLDVIRQIYGI
jgi:hypothetical protein